jgi:hypothetical protein
MPTPRASTSRRTGDTRAATTQLRVADQAARTGKDTRAKEGKGGQLTAPLPFKVPVVDKDGNETGETETRWQEFRLAEDVGIMPLMEWAAASDRDVASADGLRAVFYVLQDAVHEEDWAEFRKFTREHKIDAITLLEFANAALEALAGRPTEESTGS